MTANRKIIQLILIFLGLLLIVSTYFLYPKIRQDKLFETIKVEEVPLKIESNQSNVFQKVAYEGFYNIDNPFTVKSEQAYILENESNIVYMDQMNVTIYMNNGTEVKIQSDKGRYDKDSYDCFFEGNVRATDGKTVVLAENLDLFASKDWALAYNNVLLNNNKGSLRADKINYDFEKKHYKASMYNNEKVKIKLIK